MPLAHTASFLFPDRRRVDRVVIQEDILQGERVRGYTLEGLVEERWEPIGEGSCIGHKRIQPVDRAQVAGIRLRVTDSVDTPVIRRLAAYDTALDRNGIE